MERRVVREGTHGATALSVALSRCGMRWGSPRRQGQAPWGEERERRLGTRGLRLVRPALEREGCAGKRKGCRASAEPERSQSLLLTTEPPRVSCTRG